MAKKFLFVTVLLFLVSVQALSASCDIRCSLMGASTDSHASHTGMQMPHCHGMSLVQDKQTSLAASDSCNPTGCGTGFSAITKSADRSDAVSSKLLMSTVALLVDPFGSSAASRITAFASLSRTSDSRPLAQRPGSSLRI
jgi:hypothetical protein